MVKPCKIKDHNGKQYRCFFELTLSLIGGKWKPIILYHLAQEKVMRFGELGRSLPDITQRMLTKQLRELEADALIHREVYKEVPPKVEYSLTELGHELIPIFLDLRQWGMKYEERMLGENLSEAGYESLSLPDTLAEL